MTGADWTRDETLEAVLAELAEVDRAAPDAQFAARCRAAFIEGTLESRLGLEAGSEGLSREAPQAPQAPPTPRARSWAWLAPLAAAAAVVLIGLRFLSADDVGWRVPRSAPAAVQAAVASLSAGETLTWDGDPFHVRVASGLELRVMTGAQFGGALGSEDFELSLAAGEILIRTHRDYAGPHLVVSTPQTRVEVTGTALSVMVDEAITCICVCEGSVRVADQSESSGWSAVGQERTHVMEAGSQRHYSGDFYAPETVLGAGEAEHLAPLFEFAAKR